MPDATCWEFLQCPPERMEKCTASQNRDRGHACWKWSGTMCRGEKQGSVHEKLEKCKECKYYQSDNCIK